MTIFWSPTGKAYEFGKQVPYTDPRIAKDPRTIAWVTGKVRQGNDDEFGDMNDDLPLDDPTEGMDVDGEGLPDLGELIPHNPGQGGRGRERDEGASENGGRNVIPRGGNMADVTEGRGNGGDGNDQQLALAAAPGAGNAVSKETMVSPYPSLSYGLQETHTTVLPWTGWFSVCNLDKEAPVQLPIRMNSPIDMVNIACGY